MHTLHCYFRKTVTNELVRKTVEVETPYEPGQYKEYKEFISSAVGLPLATFLIRVK